MRKKQESAKRGRTPGARVRGQEAKNTNVEKLAGKFIELKKSTQPWHRAICKGVLLILAPLAVRGSTDGRKVFLRQRADQP